MKIIGVDNYARQSVSDIVIVEKITDVYFAARIVKLLNKAEGENGAWYFKVVQDDHKLWRGLGQET